MLNKIMLPLRPLFRVVLAAKGTIGYFSSLIEIPPKFDKTSLDEVLII